jgi:hypothetical protein
MKSVNWPKPGYTSITCSTISNIPYNLIFTTKYNDSSILITIISGDYLSLSLANEYVGDVTIPTQVIEYSQNFLQADQPIRLQHSNQIKLFWIKKLFCLIKKSYTIVCMKLILVTSLDPPPFSIDNECRLQISFDVGEIHLYTLSLLWMIRVNIYDWSHWRHCLSAFDILSFCSLRSPGNNHCNVQWKRTLIACGNANGRYLPPHVIMPGKTFNATKIYDTENAPEGTMISTSESGWTKQVII